MDRIATLSRAAILAAVFQVAPVRAATIVVNSTSDSGSACTLRNAMLNANNNNQAQPGCAAGSGADTIVFDPGVFATPQMIAIGSRLPQLTDASTTTIDGGHRVTIDGQNAAQVFWIGNLGDGSGSAVLRNLVIANGNANGQGSNGYYGGGLQMVGASLVLERVTFSGSRATFGGGGFFTQEGLTLVDRCIFIGNDAPTGNGGGLLNSGADVDVVASTFTGNSASSGGSAIFTAYGGTMTVTNSTFSGNTTTYYGSAIRNFGATALTLDYVTISGNSTGAGNGAVDTEQDATTAIRNSIVAGNTGGDCRITTPANFTDQGNNFFGDASCGRAGNGNPALGALASNGGPTQTMKPAPNSPVIDAAACDIDVPADQRGIARPQGAGCDIGAVELTPLILADGFETLLD
jgi:hypothetical protein